jgi:regulator of protease activity HflC (stomatin/prohibitin superfamily)
MAEQELNPKRFIPIAAIVVVIIILLISWGSITVTVDAGHGGVLFKRFGGGIELEKTYGEGFHFIAPWNKMYIYEVRQQEIGEDMNVLASNGLEIQVDVSTWYEPKFNKLGYLHAEIGTNYLQRVIIPSLRSAARSVVGRYTPEQIYSTKRDIIQDEIYEETKALLDNK